MDDIVAISLFFGTIIIAILCAFILGMVRIIKGTPSETSAVSDQDEARLIQEIHQGLERMEHRVESLETLMMDSRLREESQ